MISFVFNIFICCVLAVPALAETPLLANPRARSFLSLNGIWRVIPDPYETGLRSRYFLNRKPTTKSALVEYDFDSAWPLRVTGDWNSEREDLLFYEGPVWYERSFVYHKRPDSRVFLYNARRAEAIPGLDMDWWNYGGLTRDIALLGVPQVPPARACRHSGLSQPQGPGLRWWRKEAGILPPAEILSRP